MNYEKLLENIKSTPKEVLKKAIFELDQRTVKQIKQLDLDKETEREMILICKDHTFMEMLLINSLGEEDS